MALSIVGDPVGQSLSVGIVSRERENMIHIGCESYDDATKAWLAKSGHYLDNPPPGAIMCAVVRSVGADLFGHPVGVGERLGLCLLGRPVARRLPQDGTWCEITRFVLVDGLPKGTASSVLRWVFDECRRRGIKTVISYHDRTRHTGCIYRKAGMRKDGATVPTKGGAWGTRANRKSATLPPTSKRRWRLDINPEK